MTITKQIEFARSLLKAGNAAAYARAMSGSIRAAMSDRAVKAFRQAIVEDKAEHLFVNLTGSCPIAA